MRKQKLDTAVRQIGSDALYDVLLHLPDAVILINEELIVTFLNHHAASLLGAEASVLLGQPVDAAMNDADGVIKRCLKKAGTLAGSSTFEYHLRSRASWLECIIRSYGKGYSITLHDITYRKEAELYHGRLEENYELLVSSIDGIVWEFDPVTQRFLAVSQQAERLLGYPAAQWVEEPGFWENHIHPDDRDWVINYCHSNSQVSQSYEFTYRMIAADGHAVWLRDIVRVVRKEGAPVLLKGIMIDISSEKKIIDELVRAGELHSLVMKATTDVIWDWDLENNTLNWNDNFYLMLGYDKKSTAPHIDSWENSIHPEDRQRVVEGIRKAINDQEKVWSSEYRFLKADGGYIEIYDRGYLIANEAGKPVRMIGSMVDITVQKQVQEELSHSYKTIRELSEHLQNIREEERKNIAREIHDELGQQVTVMKMEITWLITKMQAEEPLVRQKMEGLLELLKETVSSIRRISSELRPSLLDDLGLRAAMEWHIREFGKRTGVKTSFSAFSGELELSDTIKVTFFRILQECLTNVARHAEASAVHIDIKYHNSLIVMTVSDDGKGMDLARLKHGKTYGILGMQERARMIGGSYLIKSHPGKGTQISVKIPWQESKESFPE